MATKSMRSHRRKKARKSPAAPPPPGWNDALAAAVRARRKSLKLTQGQLSLLAGCGTAFLYDLENGKRSVRLDKLVDVLRVLGLELRLHPGKSGLTVEPLLT